MSRSPLLALLLVLATATLAFAADLSGKWIGKLTTPDGSEVELLYTFKAEGELLTGTLTTPMGELPISDGKVKGDEFSFALSFGDRSIPFQGKVSGETLVIRSQGPQGEREFTLTRAPAR